MDKKKTINKIERKYCFFLLYKDLRQREKLFELYRNDSRLLYI